MSTPFVIDPLIHDPRVYDRISDYADDLPFWRDQVRFGHGPALELCCGSGRILLPLLAEGLDVTGIDIDSRMLGALRTKASAASLRPTLVQADIRSFDLGRRFATVYCPCNSLQCLFDTREIEAVFERVRAHLAPLGRFCFEVLHPDIRFMVEGEAGRREVARYLDEDGRAVLVQERSRYDSASQVLRLTWFFRIGDDPEVAQRLDMRCFYPQEMDALLRHNGFAVQAKFGHWDGTPFSSASRRQLYVCERE